jgi:hypothetical protein
VPGGEMQGNGGLGGINQFDFPAIKLGSVEGITRFNQLAAQFKTKLDQYGQQGPFQINTFTIRYGQTEELAQKLVEEPGPLGWGSMKALIDKHFPG